MLTMKSLMVVFVIIAIKKIITAIPTVTVAPMTTMMIMIMSNWMRLSMMSLIINQDLSHLPKAEAENTGTRFHNS